MLINKNEKYKILFFFLMIFIFNLTFRLGCNKHELQFIFDIPQQLNHNTLFYNWVTSAG